MLIDENVSYVNEETQKGDQSVYPDGSKKQEDDVLQNESDESSQLNPKTLAAEFVFIFIIGNLVVGAFIRTFQYNFSSAIAPIIITVPLIILIAFHVSRLTHTAKQTGVSNPFAKTENLKNISTIVLSMFGLAGLIFVTGHYVGICIFSIILLRFFSKEKWWVSIALALGVALAVYLLFEIALDIQLYRGLIYRMWAGYNVF